MKRDIYWIQDIAPFGLAIMPRPRGGEWLAEEVSGWSSAGIRIIACLLHGYEIDELDIRDEARYCRQFGIDYRCHPITDRSVPEHVADFLTFVDSLVAAVQGGSKVAIHCRAGIGRSGLTAAAILLRLGVPETEVYPMLSRARGLTVPDTPQQVQWLRTFRARMLAQRG